jgi:hypothetical protein
MPEGGQRFAIPQIDVERAFRVYKDHASLFPFLRGERYNMAGHGQIALMAPDSNGAPR